MNTHTNPTQFTNHVGTGNVLTVYLNLDQAVAANMNRGFGVLLDSKLREAESRLANESELEDFRRCANLLRGFVSTYRPNSVSVVLFAPLNGSVSAKEMNVAVETDVRWQDRPYIQPLLESIDEFEETLIILVDAGHSRLLNGFLGRVTEHREIINPYPTAHTKVPGHDRMKSQTTFHRKSDEHEKKYLKEVVAEAGSIVRTRSIRRIVLAGNNSATKELYFLLPKDMQARVTSFEVLPVKSTHKEIAVLLAKAQQRAERAEESSKVEGLLERSGGNRKAVVGVDATMGALTQGSVRELVYAKGVALTGARCDVCGALSAYRTTCPQCQAALKPTDDAIDLIIGAALDTDATIEQVRGKAAERLLSAGGIGAVLRF